MKRRRRKVKLPSHPLKRKAKKRLRWVKGSVLAPRRVRFYVDHNSRPFMRYAGDRRYEKVWLKMPGPPGVRGVWVTASGRRLPMEWVYLSPGPPPQAKEVPFCGALPLSKEIWVPEGL